MAKAPPSGNSVNTKPPLTFQLDGIEDLQAQLEASADEIKEQYKGLVRESTQRVFDDSQQRVAVASGDLKASGQIEFSSGGHYGRVRYKKPHAHLIEFGTVAAPAHPYLHPAVASEQGKFLPRAKEIIEKANETEAGK